MKEYEEEMDSMMNFEIFNGRIVSDGSEVRNVAGGKVTTVRVATSRPKKENEERPIADFYDITFWNRAAEVASSLAAKGKRVFVRGYTQTKQYEDKETGKKLTMTNYVAREFSFV